MMMVNSNPWDALGAKIQLSDFGTRKIDCSQPIIEPPRDSWVLEHCWPVKIRLEDEQ